jgi:hypothetical protein
MKASPLAALVFLTVAFATAAAPGVEVVTSGSVNQVQNGDDPWTQEDDSNQVDEDSSVDESNQRFGLSHSGDDVQFLLYYTARSGT